QVQRLARALLEILSAAVEQPQRVLSGWPLLARREQEELLQYFQGTPSADTRSLLSCFEDHAAIHPQQPALRYGGAYLSYQHLNARANQLAHWLRRCGVGADVLVALYMERGMEMLVGLLGVLKAGGAYVPLDPSWPPQRLQVVLGELAPSVVLTQRNVSKQVPEGSWQTGLLDEWSWLEGEDQSNLAEIAGEQSLAYVLYTSGSTGTPRGVEVRRESLQHYVAAMREALRTRPGWQYALVSTLAADLGNTVIYSALTGGGCLHIVPYETATQAEVLAEYMQRSRIDVLKIVPSHLRAVLLQGPQQEDTFPRRHLILGGEALNWDLLESVRETGTQCMLWNHYGPTETTVGVLLQPLGRASELKREMRGVSLGKPIGGNSVYIVDEWQQIVPVGVAGELYIAGKGLARGYLGKAGETADRFVPDPYSGEAGGRVYRTGDLARYGEAGQIEFLGRKDRQIKMRGYRVEPGEIEAALQKHEQVREAIVQLRGERIVGYVLGQQSLPEGRELREWLRAYVPEYMIPAAIVRLLAWPLTTNGKIDLQGFPEPEKEARVVVAARTSIEELLIQIWREVLRVQTIGIYDNFFHLDGHSLLATQVISRVRSTFNVNISIHCFFEHPTIAGLGRSIEQALRGETAEPPSVALLPVSRQQDLPLSFAQQRLWFLAQLDPQSPAYNLPYALRLRGPLQVEVLQACFEELLARHESLRTTFEVHDGQPVQRIHEGETSAMEYEYLSHLRADLQEQEVQWRVNEEAETPFDLVQGPLVRARVLKLGADEHVLLLTMHHIVSDGWSSTVLVQELSALYRGHVRGQPAVLAPLPIQYADYAVWQRQWLQGERLQRQEEYWRERLAGSMLLELPIDYVRPADQSTRGALRVARISPEVSQRLRLVSQQEGVTLFMLLLAAFQILLARYSGQEDIVVGTPIANRTRQEVEGLIGFFVNMLVMRTDLSGSPSVREVIGRVRQVCLG
ncbi:MAG TPA: amino acid adenylation domain-containing protein, partial [Ktedonobacteraceae bacterium]|nr:amino acid adenylation domain-containing protein [Ktedonobacteraceae bacterium]